MIRFFCAIKWPCATGKLSEIAIHAGSFHGAVPCRTRTSHMHTFRCSTTPSEITKLCTQIIQKALSFFCSQELRPRVPPQCTCTGATARGFPCALAHETVRTTIVSGQTLYTQSHCVIVLILHASFLSKLNSCVVLYHRVANTFKVFQLQCSFGAGFDIAASSHHLSLKNQARDAATRKEPGAELQNICHSGIVRFGGRWETLFFEHN